MNKEYNDKEINRSEKPKLFDEEVDKKIAMESEKDIMKNPLYQNKERIKNSDIQKTVTLSAILIVIAGLLIYFANSIQRMIFQDSQSILFAPKTGIMAPRFAMAFIVIGFLGIIFSIVNLVRGRKTSSVSKKSKFRAISLVSLVLIVLGIVSIYSFTDFTQGTIKQNSLFKPSVLSTYNEVTNQRVYIKDQATKNLMQEITLSNGSKIEFPFNVNNAAQVRVLDSKFNKGRNRAVDTDTFTQIVSQGLYSEEEAQRVYR